MLTELLRSHFTPQREKDSLLHLYREKIFFIIFVTSLIGALLPYYLNVKISLTQGDYLNAVIYTSAYVVALVATFIKAIPFVVRAWAGLLLFYIMGVVGLITYGPAASGRMWLFMFATLTTLVLGLRAGIVALSINVATVLLWMWGWTVSFFPWVSSANIPAEVIRTTISSFIFMTALVTVTLGLFLNYLKKGLKREQELSNKLRRSNEKLEEEGEELRAAQAAYKDSEERFRLFIQQLPGLVFIKDHKGRYLYFNDNCLEFFGLKFDEVIGKTNDQVHPPGQADLYNETDRVLLETGEPLVLTEELKYPDGKRAVMINHKFLIHRENQPPLIAGIYLDITKRVEAEEEMKALQSQLQQAQKMEALGTLAGGIAHDFNNILAVIIGYSELILEEAELRGDEPQSIQAVLQAGNRARDLVNQILTFSRKMESELMPVDLNRVVRQTGEMLERTIPKMIRIEQNLEKDLHPINADAGQLSQVIMNLAANAKDAMPEGGRLVIDTRNVTLAQGHCASRVGLAPGDYVLLTISDTGWGMDQETLKHIFDPFFTQKDVGKGTGLGLATVYGVIKNHDGHINCDSKPGQGTTFEIYFPALLSIEPDESLEPLSFEVKGGSETILMVDDEERIRDLGQRILTRKGYGVLLAETGEEALEIYYERPEEVDLVILDISMPGMGGHKCLQALLSANPKLKVIIASGYSLNGQLDDVLASGAAAFVPKPFLSADLLAAVRKVLDG